MLMTQSVLEARTKLRHIMAHKAKTKWKRQEYRKDDTCRYCKKEMHLDTNKKNGSLATVDHIIPTSKDGLDDQGNWILACEACNSKKADLIIEDTNGYDHL